MLILIAGITGNIGHHVCRSALRRGHQVRGLGRSPDRLDPALRDQLESYVVSADYKDIAAYEKACKGVDAVVVAWHALPILVVDAQLMLLRAAEEAGIRRFHGLSWNGDWTKLQLGDMCSYDPMITFARQAFQSSKIAVCYTLVGHLANTLFAVPGAGRLEDDAATWVRNGDPADNKRTINYVGSPDTKINFSPEEECSDFSVALITSNYGEKGGFYRFWSDTFSPRELKEAFESARGGQVELRKVMELEEMHDLMVKTRNAVQEAGPAEFQSQRWTVMGLEYGYHIPSGRIAFEAVDADKFPDVPRTKIADYIKKNKYV